MYCSDIYEKTEYDSSHSKSNARSGHTRSMRLREETEADSYTPAAYDVSVVNVWYFPKIEQN